MPPGRWHLWQRRKWHLEAPCRAALEGRWDKKGGDVKVGGCTTTCVDLLWGRGHSVATVRSSVLGSLARDQVCAQFCMFSLLLRRTAAMKTSVGKRSGRENPHNTYGFILT